MLCKHPFMGGSIAYGCGQCLPCRINRSRLWTWRQFLESLLHEHNCFCTLTYDDDHLPANGALQPKDLQLFLKRLRREIDPLRIRYFAVGEYGEKTRRPHYHLTLFGLSRSQILDGGLYDAARKSTHHANRGDVSRETEKSRDKKRPDFKISDEVINACWQKGFTYVSEFNEATAQYVSRYVVKYLKDKKDGWIPPVPEFARMSLRPGLGSGAMSIVAQTLKNQVQSWETGDVPHELKLGKRKIPLGRYLLSTLRDRVGFEADYVAKIKEEAAFQQSLDMLTVFANTENALTVTEAYKKDTLQKILQVESRYNIWLSKHKRDL